jgi:hypothetical protein
LADEYAELLRLRIAVCDAMLLRLRRMTMAATTAGNTRFSGWVDDMARKENDFHYIENRQFEDDKMHADILEGGDHAAAKKVSDAVAKDVGLTPAEIEALSAPPKKWKGKPK